MEGLQGSAGLAVAFGDIELVQALGRAGVECVAFAPPDSRVRLSRHVRETIVAPSTAELDPGDEYVVSALLALAERLDEPPIVFFDSDEALHFLSRNRTVLDGPLRMLLPPHDLISDLTDKARFQALAERLGLPVPPARWMIPGAAPPPEDLDLPVILKPVPRRDDSWRWLAGDSKALLATTRDELEALWSRLAEADIAVLAQREIPGPESEILSHHVYVDENGDVAGEFTGRKIRTLPAAHGMSTALVTTQDRAVADLGREVIRRVGLRGPAKLDFKRAPDGALHLLEINPRFTLWVHAGAVAGVNLPALMYADLAGVPRPVRGPARAGVRWVSIPSDREAARAAGIPAMRWLMWALRCETNSAFAWRDARPLFRRLGAGRARRAKAR